MHGTSNLPGEDAYKQEERMALTGLDFKRVAAWLVGAPAESEQVALWGKWDGHLLWGRWGSQERRGHEASHDPAKGHWRAPASRLASRCTFQGGSVLGDWHQQKTILSRVM